MSNDCNSNRSAIEQQKNSPLPNWDYPTPLTPALSPDIPYPIDALPSLLQKTVSAYQQYGQQPTALVACGALANVSLCCQALGNVARDQYLTSPTSLYFLVVASSGDRKTASDTLFSYAARRWEEAFREKREPLVQAALILHRAWQMQRSGLLSQIKRSTFASNDADKLTHQLAELIRNEPTVPLFPSLYFEDCTPEGLAHNLSQNWPSTSLWSDEGGIVLGGHGMQSSQTRFVALLNRLWDAKEYSTHRKTSDNFIVKNRRLTLNLMMQPILMQQLILQPTNIARQSGFLARCLVAYPNSLMGQRFYQEPNDTLVFFKDYNERIKDCLTETEYLTAKGCVDLPTLFMSPAAKKQWVQFFNSVESGICDKGQWSMIKDFASKAAENSARLAALFHLFEGKEGDISANHCEQAIQIIQWHLQETRRLLTTESAAAPLHNAQKLLSWLIEKNIKLTTARVIQRLSPLRDKEQRNNAIETLIEHKIMRLSKNEGKVVLELNPYST